MKFIYLFVKKMLWPGPDFGTRVRYQLKDRLLKGAEIESLDIGFGNGCLTMAAALGGKRALGVSIDKQAITRAKKFRDGMGLSADRCEFKEISAYDLSLENVGTFDQIIAFEVLEHLMNDDEVVSRCAGLLKKDGWLHICVPNRDNHIHFEGVFRTENGQHVRHGYDMNHLEALVRRHGFEPIDRLGVGGLGTVWGFLAVANARKLPGLLGQSMSVFVFFLVWPLVKIFDLIPCQPWSLYLLAAKRDRIRQ